MSVSAIGLYLAIIFAALFVGRRSGVDARRVVPVLTFTVAALLTVVIAVQCGHPALLPMVERTGGELAAGQWWRLVTALFGQDRGIAGGVSNIVFLMMLGWFAEPQLGRWRWLLLYFGTGVLAQLVALYLQPIGAGNSVANMGLAAGILVFGAKSVRECALVGIGVATAIALLCQCDIHGAAFLLGCLLAGSLRLWDRRAA